MNEPETKEHSELLQHRPEDFSLDEVYGLWHDLTFDATDPTLTFEAATSEIRRLKDLAVPPRHVADTDSTSTTSQSEVGAEYQLGGQLGEGGMGVIYEARQNSLNRTVAIKRLKRDAKTESQRSKFLAEAVLTGWLEHPNIIALHDLAIDQNENLFYSMKKINGEPWVNTINEKSLGENLEIFNRVCNAIAFAHSRSVIHRDIKPGNVMLGEFGEVLLMDWGLAVVLPENRSLTESEFPGLGGTPAYMSPELARGDFRLLGKASDIYLLGALLYHIVTRTPPHQGDSVQEVLLKAANNEIEPTSKQGELYSIALKAMATDPADRFTSATDLKSMIGSFQSHTQSMGLTRRAKKLAKRARQSNDYAMFAQAILTFEEAIDVWADNKKAINGLGLTRKFYTEAAIENGDLDLAASILETNDSENGTHTESLSLRVDQLKKDRVKKEKQRVKDRKDLLKWSRAFNVSPDIVAISRLRDGLIYEVNEAYLKRLGYKRDEVIGKTMNQLQIWVDLTKRAEFVRNVESKGHLSENEAMIRTKSGEEFPCLLSARVLDFEGEKAMITHAHDISHRKKMEQALSESESRLRETQELAKLGTWEYDLNTEKIIWSEETYRIIGFPPESREPSLEVFLSTVHPDDLTTLLELINRAQTDGTPYRCEVRHRHPDGCYRYVLATGKPKFENGKVVLLFGSVMDITEFRDEEC